MAKLKKINKNQFVSLLGKRLGFGHSESSKFYGVFMSTIEDVLMSGCSLSLTGFGSFKLQTHKGHPAQYREDGTKKQKMLDDYVVLKFNTSNSLNKRFRKVHKKGKIKHKIIDL